MTLNYVTLVLDGYAGSGGLLNQGTATLTPSVLLASPGSQWIPPGPVGVNFRKGLSSPQVTLLATDNGSVTPAGWGWTISFQNVLGNPESFSFFLPFANGATQYLSQVQPVSTVTTMQAYMPLPSGTAQAGQVPVATGIGGASAWKFSNSTVNALDYGADPTGANASDAATALAVAAVPAAGGAVVFPPGTYKYSSGITVARAGVYLTTLTPGTAIFNYTGSGDCVRMYSSLPYTSGWGGGVIGGIIIDGTNAAAGACGIHAGDIYQFRWDATVRKFQGTGSKGYWFDNQYFWAEDMAGRIFAQQNTANVIFDNSANISGQATGSFARTLLDIVLDCKGVGDGAILRGGVVLYDHRVSIYGNMDYSTTGTKYWALQITGSNGGQFSRMQAGSLNVGVEINATSGIQPGTISFGTAGSNYLRGCTGIIDFGGSAAFAAASNWDGSFQFDGPVLGDVNLKRSAGSGTSHYSAGAIGNGGFLTTRFDSIIQAFPSSNVTGVILGTGDPGLSGTGWADQTVTVVNTGSGSITFAATGTSHVSTGASCVIPAGQAMTFIWIANSSTWYPVV